MDVRLSAEQRALRDSAVQVVVRLGPRAVAELGDEERVTKLDAAVGASGWRELRTPTEDGTPWASAVEVAIVAEELGRGLADTSFLGPTLAAELRRLTGSPPAESRETVTLAPGLSAPASAPGGVLQTNAMAIDAHNSTSALVLVPVADGYTVGEVTLGGRATDVDLTRPVATWGTSPKVTEVEGQSRVLHTKDVTRWCSLGLAMTCADLVGVMRGALELASDYARSRRQYGAAIGSFQAVQHLLADACVSIEGSRSVALHATWGVDALPFSDALRAASVAKAYCARAARAVCETAIQVHGGIGNTWDCLAHLYLRRALLSSDVLGGVGVNLARALAAHGIAGDDGLR